MYYSLFSGTLLTSTMRWSRWRVSITLYVFYLLSNSTSAVSSQNFKISPKPCTVSGVEGTCLFVWECIKSEGTHLGICMDGFMFGSCCGHNVTENFVLPPSTPFRPSFKPTNSIKKRPSKPPNNPNSSGTFTIERPNGSGTLVIRQPQRPQKTKTTTKRPSSTKNPLDNFNDLSNELSASASFSASKYSEEKYVLKQILIQCLKGSWSSTPWQVTTEPNFITKTKSPWDKTTSMRPKPKPTKKPITYGSTSETETRKPTTFKPKPPVSVFLFS